MAQPTSAANCERVFSDLMDASNRSTMGKALTSAVLFLRGNRRVLRELREDAAADIKEAREVVAKAASELRDAESQSLGARLMARALRPAGPSAGARAPAPSPAASSPATTMPL